MSQEFEAVIGLEVHTQLSTESKIFCPCRARLAEGVSVSDIAPNSNICPVCSGQPGSLPVLNRKVVEYAVKAGLATHCRINEKNTFSRKNYFYPDLPKGYQISQYDQPICEGGHLTIETQAGTKRIGITRIHMEEDAGKNVHHGSFSVVNLNRAGVPLCEIVSEPEMRTSEEAGSYLRALHSVVTYLGICDGNMQEGNFRCDANVSVRPQGSTRLGTRVEIKNVNSFRFVEKAIDYEIARQIELIRSGSQVVQETRLYDADKNATFSMRSKEEAQDYRYFPEPDLIPLSLERAWINKIRSELPELPEQKRARWVSELGLSSLDANTLTASRVLCVIFEETLVECQRIGLEPQASAKTSANLITGEVTRLLKEQDSEVLPISAQHIAELVKFIQASEVSSTGAKQALGLAWKSGESIGAIVDREGLRQVSDLSALEPIVNQIIAGSPAQAAEFRAGKEKVLGFFVGQVMKQTGGKANPGLIQELIRKKLSSE